MSEINLYWYKTDDGNKNFGDELGPFIVGNLSGLSISYIPIVHKRWKILPIYMYGLTKGIYRLSDYKGVLKGLIKKNTLISVGSIINYYGGALPTIWGAGIITTQGRIKRGKFLAVRGKYTQKRLKELNYNAPDVVGDPALLLPRIVKRRASKKYRLGIIPHYIHHEETLNLFPHDDVLVINLFDNIKKVIEDINSCDVTVSSSLHGIIVSHAYGIKCLWYELSSKRLSGDNIKFYDYFSSVGIAEYKPFKLMDENNILVNTIIDNITHNEDINKININLSTLQKRLLKVAPFPLKQEYIEFIRGIES